MHATRGVHLEGAGADTALQHPDVGKFGWKELHAWFKKTWEENWRTAVKMVPGMYRRRFEEPHGEMYMLRRRGCKHTDIVSHAGLWYGEPGCFEALPTSEDVESGRGRRRYCGIYPNWVGSGQLYSIFVPAYVYKVSTCGHRAGRRARVSEERWTDKKKLSATCPSPPLPHPGWRPCFSP